MHPRQAIREAARTALVGAVTVDDVTTYATAAGTRVYETRKVPHRGLQLPAIAVYTLQESVDPESASSSARYLTRRLQLMIEAFVAPGESDNVDDAMDDICAEIEAALHADETLDGTCIDSLLASTEFEIGVDGNKEIGLAQLVYNVTYETQADDDSNADYDDFETAGLTLAFGEEETDGLIDLTEE